MRVGIHYQSDRHHTVQEPLAAVGVETVHNPDSYADCDAIICGSPGLLSDHLRFAGPVVYRLRGNLWEERGGHLAKPRAWVKDKLFRGLCDGILAPDSRLHDLARRRTTVSRVGVVGLPVHIPEWPRVEHTADVVRAVTLTNFDYEKKIAPLYRFTEIADEWLADNGGRWVVCGDGEHADVFADHCDELAAVDFRGYQPAAQQLQAANVMIHPSNMDAQLPNAILEGIASNLPVVTSDSQPFPPCGAYQPVTGAALVDTLERLSAPSERRTRAEGGQAYVAQHHSHDAIGHKLRSFIEGYL